MKKIIFILLALCSLQLVAHSQFNICKTYLFIQSNFAGTIAVDENGKEITSGVTSSVFVYIKAKNGEIPKFETAIINGINYNVSMLPCTDGKAIVGKTDEDGKPIILKASNGCKLWKLTFEPETMPAIKSPKTTLTIALKATWKERKITYTISKVPILLQAEERP